MTHEPTVREVSYMIDQCFCSCGWSSSGYFDGAEYAFSEFKKHLALAEQTLPVVEQTQPLAENAAVVESGNARTE